MTRVLVGNYKKIFSYIPVVSKTFFNKTCIILILLNLYVIAHILFSPNNILSYYKTENSVNSKKETLREIMIQNQEYEKEISMLKSEKLDRDYLEELARKQLNYSYSDEKVIVYSDNIKNLI